MMNHSTQAYIVIEGVIGVGKTTLARMFRGEMGAQLVLEVFEENPFLSDFYTDRSRYAFQTQIFFLLSRYHQQLQLAAIPRPLISDYMFDKDRLFAQVNLDGDELDTYYRVQEALAENICTPDLIVYLRADTETLLNRITARDRPYERNMEAAYIESLRVAYEQFFANYHAAPVLTIDTNNIDFVRNSEDFEDIVQRIWSALGKGPRQPALPGLNGGSTVITTPPPDRRIVLEQTARRLGDFQLFHRQLDRDKQFITDPYINFILLQEEIGELASAFAQRWIAKHTDQPDSSLPAIREELADVLAYVIKLANYAGVDLEAAYLEKMRINADRTWRRSESDES
ncbi:MAG: deoxynucleoside kinase [Anaerolineae bacterium]|nr:deoxynucleoside kinase [Anaerolineae bacterium]